MRCRVGIKIQGDCKQSTRAKKLQNTRRLKSINRSYGARIDSRAGEEKSYLQRSSPEPLPRWPNSASEAAMVSQWHLKATAARKRFHKSWSNNRTQEMAEYPHVLKSGQRNARQNNTKPDGRNYEKRVQLRNANVLVDDTARFNFSGSFWQGTLVFFSAIYSVTWHVSSSSGLLLTRVILKVFSH